MKSKVTNLSAKVEQNLIQQPEFKLQLSKSCNIASYSGKHIGFKPSHYDTMTLFIIIKKVLKEIQETILPRCQPYESFLRALWIDNNSILYADNSIFSVISFNLHTVPCLFLSI